MDDNTLAGAALFTLCLVSLKKANERKKRRSTIVPVNKKINVHEQFQHFLKLKYNDPKHFSIYTRMSVKHFDIILYHVSQNLMKTSIGESLSPEHQLAMTLQ